MLPKSVAPAALNPQSKQSARPGTAGPARDATAPDTAMSDADTPAAAIAALRRHYADIVMPIWRGRGFDTTRQLPFEAVLADTVPAPIRYRAMACARQLYVFSEVGERAHADRLFGALNGHFADRRHGGFIYSIDANGKPLDTDKDLYTHAFVIFACAAYLDRFGVAAARAVLDATTDLVARRFSVQAPSGLANAAFSNDFSVPRLGIRQNPLMHLTEAYLLARQVTGNRGYDDLLGGLLHGIAQQFVDAASGCIMELPVAEEPNWIEPGHQFEWFYLFRQSQHAAFVHSTLAATLPRAFRFASRHGVDADTGGVAASLDRSGAVQDHTQRIWAQAEYLRALACHPDIDERQRLAAQIRRFDARFLHAHGWHECRAADGTVSRRDMPSTTPYHLWTAYAALP